MFPTQVKDRKQGEEVLIEKARSDDAFRRQLIADPKSTISQMFGVQLPPGLAVTVLEESARQVYLVLPAMPAAVELADEELEAVAGGTLAEKASGSGKWTNAPIVAVGSALETKAAQ